MTKRQQVIRRAILHCYVEWRNDDHLHDQNPTEINAGQCENFASRVKKKLANWGYGNIEVVGCEVGGYEALHKKWGGHVWVHDYKGHRYYDVECPRGVGNWKNLPFYRRKFND